MSASGFSGPLDFATDAVSSAIGKAQAGVAKLERALTVITILAGVGAGAGLLNLLTRRR